MIELSIEVATWSYIAALRRRSIFRRFISFCGSTACKDLSWLRHDPITWIIKARMPRIWISTPLQEANRKADGRDMLPEKLSKLLDKRRLKEAEVLRKLTAEHAAELKHREAIHQEELDMKDTAHRRCNLSQQRNQICSNHGSMMQHTACSKGACLCIAQCLSA